MTGKPTTGRIFVKEPVTRWYYLGPMFRGERPAKGRYRQFYQLGCELYGDPGPTGDAEMIEMLASFLRKIGITAFEIRLSSIGSGDTRDSYRQALVDHWKGSRPLVIPKLVFGRPFWDVIRPFYHPWVPAAVRNAALKTLVWMVQGDMGRLGFPPAKKRVHATSNANIVNNIHYRRVVVKQGIGRIEGKAITFADGTTEEFDTLIAATGYLLDLDFIKPEVVPIRNNGLDLYMRIVPPDRRGLYFLGFFNSDTAANWIMEGQVRWLREFLSGHAELPAREDMIAEIARRRLKVLADFKDTPRHEIEVEHLPYFRDLKQTLAEGHARKGRPARDVGIGAKGRVPEFAAAE